MNDSNPTTNLRIEGRPTAVAGRAVHFGSLIIELAPEAPTPNLQTHCVLHAQLHLHGGGFVWRQIDSAFQVIGQIAEQHSEPRTSTASTSAAPIQPPGKPAAGQRTAPGSEPAAPAPQDVAAHEQLTTGAATASPKPSAGAGGNVSAFQRVSRGPSASANTASTPSSSQTSKPASVASGAAGPKSDPYGSLVTQQQASRNSATPVKSASAGSAPASPSAGTAGQTKASGGGSAFAQLVGQGSSRAQTSSAGGAAPNTGFRAGGGDDPDFQDIPF